MNLHFSEVFSFVGGCVCVCGGGVARPEEIA